MHTDSWGGGTSSSQRLHTDSQGVGDAVNIVRLGSSKEVRLQGLEDEPQLHTEASTDRRASAKVWKTGSHHEGLWVSGAVA